MQRQSSAEYQRLFDIKKTQIEMVRDRGYNIPQEELQLLNTDLSGFLGYVDSKSTLKTLNAFRSALGNNYTGINLDGTPKSMLVFYANKPSSNTKIPVQIIRDFLHVMEKYIITEAILIVNAPLSDKGNDTLKAIKMTKWQIFYDEDLTYNPTTHIFTPKHEALTQDEVKSKLAEWKVDISKLLIIESTDPIVKYYGWTPGQVIRIYRNDDYISVLTPKSINYRVVL